MTCRSSARLFFGAFGHSRGPCPNRVAWVRRAKVWNCSAVVPLGFCEFHGQRFYEVTRRELERVA